ncbi:energy-coupling factor transporter transmembrane component T family protein [Rhodococcus sp. OK302]|uniref:energy-coupling factor transporter transmembrane component T family protein n=1 Tax=Rhodococcus sp. OK302 TaxID=1882769 RepID=UPI000B94327F|nr:energy-coupling factor transporter transmembrane protein EcfT [Rhodococcus sp. OK302]OYD69590.1 energy-coupling factor transport system permease protein [Rhodococcus sp. OK302]
MTTLLREVPTTSPIHRLWAGTKIIAVVLISLVLVIAPSWPSIAVIVGLLLVTAIIGRVPLSAFPRPPWWIWLLLLGGALVNLPIGLDAVYLYLRAITFGIVLLCASLMLALTTSMSDVAPALATLGRPLRFLRIPVDEWAIAAALCIRSLPLLIEEMLTLAAARRLRPKGVVHSASDNTIIDLITTTMSVAIRRSAEMGEAISARGGTGLIAAYPKRPQRADLIAIFIVTVSCVGAIVLTVILRG